MCEISDFHWQQISRPTESVHGPLNLIVWHLFIITTIIIIIIIIIIIVWIPCRVLSARVSKQASCG